MAGFTPPAYLVDGVLQRGYLYSLTARTGHGKTAVGMYVAQSIARGLPMHGREVKAGTVLLLAGENPDDIRARFLVLADAYGFKAEDLKMRFVAGVIDIAAKMPEIRAEAEKISDLVLVIVDTGAAYFPGDETNSNSQQGAYARLLRQLTFLPGKPAVLVNCHPVKNASRDNLLPMGGSAFLNEVDGNLTLWATAERQTTLHWQGKFRGPEFEPMTFELEVADSARVIDAEGRLMPSVVAKPVSELKLQMEEGKQESEENYAHACHCRQPEQLDRKPCHQVRVHWRDRPAAKIEGAQDVRPAGRGEAAGAPRQQVPDHTKGQAGDWLDRTTMMIEFFTIRIPKSVNDFCERQVVEKQPVRSL